MTRASKSPARTSIDREGLLAALVLAPATYSRNRFFELYKDPELYGVRRRASQIRSIVRHVTGDVGELRESSRGGDRIELTYAVPSLGLKRTALLDPIEIALVRYAIARARSSDHVASADPDRARVEAALARLAPQTAGM